jgi:hypothetical protein
MDDVENPVESVSRFQQRFDKVATHVETLGIDPLVQQGLQNGLAALERNLSFGCGTAHKHGNTPKIPGILNFYSH